MVTVPAWSPVRSGYRWFLAATKEVVNPEDMQKRWNKMMEGGKVE